jgi:hypothetical protein
MANHLDLPAEILPMVIHELVDSIQEEGPYYRVMISPTWKLRSVCRGFAAEIEREVFSQQPNEFYSKNYGVQRLIQNSFSRYMMQISRKAGNVKKWFFTRLQRMAHYVVEQVDCEIKTNVPTSSRKLMLA